MNNLLIVWNDSNNLGIGIIDEQHRGIVSTINSLHYIIRTDQTDKLFPSIVKTIEDYTKTHFATEEIILKASKYPDFEKHKSFHEKLKQLTFAVSKESELLDHPLKFLDFLKDWWMNHINKNDRAYADHVKKYIKEQGLQL